MGEKVEVGGGGGSGGGGEEWGGVARENLCVCVCVSMYERVHWPSAACGVSEIRLDSDLEVYLS